MNQWTEEDDIALCEAIADQELHDQNEQIDFDEIANGKRKEENANRWAALLKGVGSIMPGMRYSPADKALQIKELIETRDQRYAEVLKMHSNE